MVGYTIKMIKQTCKTAARSTAGKIHHPRHTRQVAKLPGRLASHTKKTNHPIRPPYSE